MWFRRVEKSLRKGLDDEDTLVIVLWRFAAEMTWVARLILDKLDRRGVRATWLMPVQVPRLDLRDGGSVYDQEMFTCQSGGVDSEDPVTGSQQSLTRTQRRHARYFDQRQGLRFS